MKKRNNAVDVMKFIFSLLILFYHTIYVISPDSIKIYPGGGVYRCRVFLCGFWLFDGLFCF